MPDPSLKRLANGRASLHLRPLNSNVMPIKRVHVFAWLLLALLAGSFVQGVLGWPYQLRFASSWVNYWAFAVAAIFFPFLAGFLVMSLSAKWARRLSFVFAALLIFPCLLMASCAALDAPQRGKVDASYELISEAGDGAVAYRLYRTNCGATCAYGLSLREERNLFLGAKLVSPRWGIYRASEGQVVLKDSKILVLDGGSVLVELSR
jgi:hypothetical protein